MSVNAPAPPRSEQAPKALTLMKIAFTRLRSNSSRSCGVFSLYLPLSHVSCLRLSIQSRMREPTLALELCNASEVMLRYSAILEIKSTSISR